LYYEVVDAYIAKRLFTNALPLLEKMIETEETDVPETWTRMAESMHHLGNSKSAIDLYNSVLELRPNDNDIRLKLAEIYSELGDSELAVEMANQMEAISKIAQVQDMNSDTTLVAQPVAEEEQDDDALEGTTIEGSSKSRPRRNLPLGQKDKMLIILEEKNKIQETRQLYDKIQSLLSSINEFLVRRDCLRTFRKLVAPFIRAREFYPADRAKKFAGFRLPNSLKDDPFLREAYAKDMFRGLHFEQWYQAFIEVILPFNAV
jgi:general transcription factor 3C polypeptide 3 (transcription factor C subunit 4)